MARKKEKRKDPLEQSVVLVQSPSFILFPIIPSDPGPSSISASIIDCGGGSDGEIVGEAVGREGGIG